MVGAGTAQRFCASSAGQSLAAVRAVQAPVALPVVLQADDVQAVGEAPRLACSHRRRVGKSTGEVNGIERVVAVRSVRGLVGRLRHDAKAVGAIRKITFMKVKSN